uniref:Uncharacterized protein n=1 Tax=Rhizophora mucronata TaxID=61149 RepID=A0A2P2Q8C4_RHIMU
MHSLVPIYLICLNFRAVKMLLYVLEAHNILIDILADLKLAMEAVSLHAVPAKPKIAIYAENVFLVLSELPMLNTSTKEIAIQQCTKPIRFLLLCSELAFSHHLFCFDVN